MASATIGALEVHAFHAHHDAAGSLGFRIESSAGVCVGWGSDMGHWDEQTVEHMRGVHLALVEANYDQGMLERGRYAPHHKRRIAGPRGHLSNRQAAGLLDAIVTPALRHVVLGHLSANNNDPFLALERAGAPLRGGPVEVTVASRHDPTTPLTFEP